MSWFVKTAYRKLPGHEHTRVMALLRPQILVIAPPALLMIPTPLPLLPPCEQTRARYSCISCSRVYYQPTFPRGSSSLLTPIRRHPISRPTRLDQGPSLIPTQTKVQVENYRQMTVSSLLPRINKDLQSLPITFSCSKIIFCQLASSLYQTKLLMFANICFKT